MKNGATAAIWSCREDFVAIVIGQAILIRPMLSRPFWIGGKYKDSRGYSSGPSKNSRTIGGSYEMNARRSQKGKAKDPFSVTAALATALGDGNSPPHASPTGSTENMIDPSIGTIEKDPVTEPHSTSAMDLESGPSARNSKRMVIHVSQKVSVDHTQLKNDAPKQNYWTRDPLQASSNARVWNQPRT